MRESETTVLRWLKRYAAEGSGGLQDALREGRPGRVTLGYRERLVAAVRRRPRALGPPVSLWTLQRLVDPRAEATGIGVSYETVRLHLKQAGMVLSRPPPTISSPDPAYLVKKRPLQQPATA